MWVSGDAHICILIISTISEAYFHHVQRNTSHDLRLSLVRAYAPAIAYSECILKQNFLK